MCGAEPVFCWKEDPSGGRASSFGWWDPPGRIDPMIGGAGDIRSWVSLLRTFLKLLDSFWGGSRMVCARSLRDRVVCGDRRDAKRSPGAGKGAEVGARIFLISDHQFCAS